MVFGSALINAIVANRSVLTLADVTPIARLASEYEALMVPAQSGFRSLPDLIRVFRENPESISWAGGGPTGPDHLLAWLIADAVGVDPKRVNYIAFAGGGDMMPAVLGGQVSVGINSISPAAPYVDAGTVGLLGVASAERVPGLSVPTLREQGIDIELENWRALVAPPGVSVADRQRFEAAVATLVRSSKWRDALRRYRWNDRFLSGPEFARFLAAEEVRVRDMTRKLGSNATNTETAGSYPVFILAALVVMGLIFANELRRSTGRCVEPAGAGWPAVQLVAVGIVADVIFIERLGFILAAMGLFWTTARAFDRDHPLRDVGWAAALSVTAYLVFSRLLELPLPAGVLERWL
jgi:putative tricarboxylic transport membrane protein